MTAAGWPLPFRQQDLVLDGRSMEARICAEEPDRNFLPSTGSFTRFGRPHGANMRLDSGIQAGSRASVSYDSLLAKAKSWR